jgi:hypothetical protein
MLVVGGEMASGDRARGDGDSVDEDEEEEEENPDFLLSLMAIAGERGLLVVAVWVLKLTVSRPEAARIPAAAVVAVVVVVLGVAVVPDTDPACRSELLGTKDTAWGRKAAAATVADVGERLTRRVCGELVALLELLLISRYTCCCCCC